MLTAGAMLKKASRPAPRFFLTGPPRLLTSTMARREGGAATASKKTGREGERFRRRA